MKELPIAYIQARVTDIAHLSEKDSIANLGVIVSLAPTLLAFLEPIDGFIKVICRCVIFVVRWDGFAQLNAVEQYTKPKAIHAVKVSALVLIRQADISTDVRQSANPDNAQESRLTRETYAPVCCLGADGTGLTSHHS